jgi:hypothetical protein
VSATTTPQTLSEAHDHARRVRPKPDADLLTWQAFHLRKARLHAEIADIDRGHHHEALYWVGYEQRKAAEFAQLLGK